jgi:hypothetical protein
MVRKVITVSRAVNSRLLIFCFVLIQQMKLNRFISNATMQDSCVSTIPVNFGQVLRRCSRSDAYGWAR